MENNFKITNLIAIVMVIVFMCIGKIDPYWGTVFVVYALDMRLWSRKKFKLV